MKSIARCPSVRVSLSRSVSLALVHTYAQQYASPRESAAGKREFLFVIYYTQSV